MSLPSSSPAVRFFEVTEHQEGQRLDNFLFTRLKGVPKSHVYRLIRAHEVRVNKKRVKADTRLHVGDVVRVAPVKTAEQATAVAPTLNTAFADNLATRILFQADGLIVFNKPAGMAVHGGSGVSLGVIESLRAVLSKPHLELIHRIDKETSGLLLLSEKRAMLKHVQHLFREKEIEKTYHAICKGVFKQTEYWVDAPLLKQELPSGERRVKVSPQGKPSQTRFQVIRALQQCTYVQAQPFTGRTHQIRVHALSIGHPLLGDDKYGHLTAPVSSVARRLCLHAKNLQLPDFPLFDAPLPDDFQQVLTQLS